MTAHKGKVLLIDDDPVVISLYTALFRHSGYDVDTASDGEEGLTRLAQSRPDAVVLDLQMPKVNGLEWLLHARADLGRATPPIVILTTSEIGVTMQAARHAGATEVLSKYRSNPDQVVDTVVALLGKTSPGG